MQESKQEVTKVIPLVKMAEKLQRVSIPFNLNIVTPEVLIYYFGRQFE